MRRGTEGSSEYEPRHRRQGRAARAGKIARSLPGLIAAGIAAAWHYAGPALAGLPGFARRAFGELRTWRTPRLAAAGTLIAAAVLVPLGVASGGGAKHPAAGPKTEHLNGAFLTGAGPSTDNGPLGLTETVLTGTSFDKLCGTPTTTGSLLGEGSEACYQITVVDSTTGGKTAGATGVNLNLQFVDSNGNPSTEEQFRTQSFTPSGGSATQVTAPISVGSGFSDAFSMTADDSGGNTAAQATGTLNAAPTTNTGSNLGSLQLSLGNENTSGSYTVAVAGVLNNESSAPGAVFLKAQLTYSVTSGTSTASDTSTCDQSTTTPCAAQVTPALPDVSVQKTLTTTTPALDQNNVPLAQSGDQLNYQVAITDPSSSVPAYQLGLCDTAGSTNLVSGSLAVTASPTPSGNSAPSDTLPPCGTANAGVPGTGTLQPGGSVTYTYSMTVPAGTTCALSGQPSTVDFCNIAVGDWQSAAAAVSTYNVSPAPVPYATSNQGSVSLDVVGGPKLTDSVSASPTGTQPAWGSGNNYSVVAGETLAYTLTVQVPEGGLGNFTIEDTLPSSLDATTVAGTAPTAFPGGNSTSQRSGLKTAATSPSVAGSKVTFSFGSIANTGTAAAPFTFGFTANAAAVAVPPTTAPASDQAQMGWTTPDGTAQPLGSAMANAQAIQVVTLPTFSVTRLTGSNASGFDSNCYTSGGAQVPEGSQVCYQININPGSASIAGAPLVLSFADPTKGDAVIREQFRTQTTNDVPAPLSVTGTSSDVTVAPDGTITPAASTVVAAPSNSGTNLTLTLGSISAGTTPAVIDVAGILTGAPVNAAAPLPVAIDAGLTSTYTLPGGTIANGFQPTGSDSPPVTPIAPTVGVSKTITNDNPPSGGSLPIGEQGDTVDYQVVITNNSPAATDPATAYNLGFCDTLASTYLAKGTKATYTYSGGTAKTATSIPPCPTPPSTPPGVTGNLPGTQVNLAPGQTETITYTLTLPSPPSGSSSPASACTSGSIANFCNDGIAEWQIPQSLPSTSTAQPTGDTLTPSLTGTAQLVDASSPTLSASTSVTSGSLVTLGQEIDYTFTLQVPSGGLKSVVLTASLPAGIGVASTSATPGGTLLGATIDKSSQITGSPYSGALTAATVGTTDGSDTSAIANLVTFNFGDIANNTSSSESLVFDVPAWVLDIAANQGNPPAKTATTLDSIGNGGVSNIALTYTTTDTSNHTPTALSLPSFTVAEPDVAVAETVAPDGSSTLPPVIDVNDHLVITDVVTNTGASTAYNTVVTTAIPAGFSQPTITSANASPDGKQPPGAFAFDVPPLAAGASETVTWTILADVPATLGTGATSVLGAPVTTWSSLTGAPSGVPAGNKTPNISADTSDSSTGSTADVGLTSPAISALGATQSTVQIGQRYTYSVSFTVPATGANNVVLTSTLSSGLAYALSGDNTGNVTCTTSPTATPTDAGCVTISPAPGAPAGSKLSAASTTALQAVTLPAPTGGGTTLAVDLGNISYPGPASVNNPAPTVQVTVSYDVYATAAAGTTLPTVTLPSSPGGTAPDTASVTYSTVPGGAASTPLSSNAAPLTVINPQLAAPSTSVSPVHAEVGVLQPGPALVQITSIVAAPTAASTAYGATLTVNLPAGLLAVAGSAESGVPGAIPVPGCTGDTTPNTCITGSAASGSTVTAFKPAASPPKTCTASDPATAGTQVVGYLPALPSGSQSLVLTFDACVVPGTTFGTGSAQTVNASVNWYSQPPNPPPPPTGSLAAFEYGPAAGTATVDFTGTSISTTLAASNDAKSAGYTIGDTVPYDITVGLPEAADPSVTPPANPTSPVTLPGFSVCVFLPAGLAYGDASPLAPINAGAGIVSGTLPTAKAVTSSFNDTNCPTQLSAQPNGTTLVELDYPAGTQVYYDGNYAGDSFVQPFNVAVGPDPLSAKLAKGATETVAASVGVDGRSQTPLSAAKAFTITEPELSLKETLNTTSKQGAPITGTVELTNSNTDGLGAPAYNSHVVITAPASTTGKLFLGSIDSTTQADLAMKSPPAPTPATGWTGVVTNSITGTGNDTIDYTSPDPTPGQVIIFTFNFSVGPLVLNGQTINVTASLAGATSQSNPNTPGRTYSSTGTGPSAVAAASSTITVAGPTAALQAAITGPGASVAPGATPAYHISITNAGPDPLSQINVQVSSNPALGNLLVTADPNNGTYTQSSGDLVFSTALGSGATAHLTATGTVPQTARGNLTVAVAATTSPATTGVAQVVTATDTGKASVTESLQVAVDTSVKIAAQGNLYSGQRATYVMTVSNAGPSAAGNITLTETPPSGTGFIDSSGSGWSCGKSFPLTCTFAGPLAPGGTAQVTTDLVVDIATGQTMIDTAQVSTANNDPNATTTATASGVVLASLTNQTSGSTATQTATAASSQPQTVSSGSPASSSNLAFTGDNEESQGLFALLVLLAGCALVLASRWRRSPAPAGQPAVQDAPVGDGGERPATISRRVDVAARATWRRIASTSGQHSRRRRR